MRRLWFSLISIAVVLMPALVSAQVSCPNGQIRGGVCFPTNTGLPEPAGGVAGILGYVMNWLLAMFAIIAIIAFVISGIQYLTSAGDDSQAESAKRTMKFAMIGVLVGLSAYIIIDAIRCMLSGGVAFGPFSLAC